jgi:hypothetical protein
MAFPPPLQAIIKWLRAGYPQGIPPQDFIPLLALMPRKLSEDEIRELATTLNEHRNGTASNIDIGVLITKITNELPREEDVERIRQRIGELVWEDGDNDSANF